MDSLFVLVVVGLMIAVFVIWLLTRIVVIVGSTEIAILERRYIGGDMPAGRAFALDSEKGVRAEYLGPGLRIIPWPFQSVVMKTDFVTIGPDELGVITATDGAQMSSGRVFAEDAAGDKHDNFQDPIAFLTQGGIRGKQLRFLTNGTFKIHPLLFRVQKIAKTSIPEGFIGVVTAADGLALDQSQLLGRRVEGHENFQRAEVFLQQQGQKGPQVDFLRPGTYNILTDMFNVSTFPAVRIGEDQIGIVDARDGLPMRKDDVVAETPDVKLHNSFQDGQAFLISNGHRGPQESVLRPGTYYVNPYLFQVALRPLTTVKQGEVGVLISNIGKDPSESGLAVDAGTRHVVPEGFRGIQQQVLGPGKYNLNPLAYTVVIVPTTMRSVEWAKDGESSAFDPFTVVSHDGFEMKVEVRCQYRIPPENAPFVVQKLGSVTELEKNVIHPQIDGIFRAQVSKSPAISYQQNRAVEQSEAENAVRNDLANYKVQVVSVMITNIHLPEALMKTTQQKNLAEQEQSMFDAKKKAEDRRIEYEKTRAQADEQGAIMKAQVGVNIVQYEAQQKEKLAEGEAARIRIVAVAQAEKTRIEGDAEAGVIRAKGEAQAKGYADQVRALTPEGLAVVEVMKAVTAAGLKITPDIVVSGGAGGDSGGQSGLVQLLLVNMLKNQATTSDAGKP